MELETYLAQLREDLTRATALADEPTRAMASRLVDVLEPSLRLVLVQALSEAAAITTTQLGGPVVEVRLQGREPVVQVRDTNPASITGPVEDDEGSTSRITLRLPEGVKKGADAAAAEQGVSLNSWITRACRQALDQRSSTHSSRRISGWA